MNIFYLHHDPKLCAQYHVDKHVVKMILETAQLLSTAHWLSGGEGPYRATHKNQDQQYHYYSEYYKHNLDYNPEKF